MSPIWDNHKAQGNIELLSFWSMKYGFSQFQIKIQFTFQMRQRKVGVPLKVDFPNLQNFNLKFGFSNFNLNLNFKCNKDRC